MRARHALASGVMVAVGAALGLPLTVAAHALPQSAIPAEGSEVQTAPKIVEITFGEPPDPKLSSITVVNSSGASVDAGPTMPVPGKPLELEVPLKPIGNGVYTVTWKTVSETPPAPTRSASVSRRRAPTRTLRKQSSRHRPRSLPSPRAGCSSLA
jgi:methionine-rich copper-binding protein CopC